MLLSQGVNIPPVYIFWDDLNIVEQISVLLRLCINTDPHYKLSSNRLSILRGRYKTIFFFFADCHKNVTLSTAAEKSSGKFKGLCLCRAPCGTFWQVIGRVGCAGYTHDCLQFLLEAIPKGWKKNRRWLDQIQYEHVGV